MTGRGPGGRKGEPSTGGLSRPEGGKPTPEPGDIYEIEDDTGAIIITGAPVPWCATKPARKPPKASPTWDEERQGGGE